jgi:hypothetical protein
VVPSVKILAWGLATKPLVFKRGEEVKAVSVAEFGGGRDRITVSRIDEEKMGGDQGNLLYSVCMKIAILIG